MNLDGQRAHAVLGARKAITFARVAIKQTKQELTGMREATHARKKEVADMVPGRLVTSVNAPTLKNAKSRRDQPSTHKNLNIQLFLRIRMHVHNGLD